jgi:hypothetical protein
MSFWDIVGQIIIGAMDHNQKIRAKAQRDMDRRMKEYERKLGQAERTERMNDPEYAENVRAARAQFNAIKENTAARTGVTCDPAEESTTGGRTMREWESSWKSIGLLSTMTSAGLSQYSRSIGLYKAEIDGRTQYIGRALEYQNGGLRKRIMDYVRDSGSARGHGSGRKMHRNADRIQLFILVVGDSPEDVETVKALEKQLIAKHGPPWNVQHK